MRREKKRKRKGKKERKGERKAVEGRNWRRSWFTGLEVVSEETSSPGLKLPQKREEERGGRVWGDGWPTKRRRGNEEWARKEW